MYVHFNYFNVLSNTSCDSWLFRNAGWPSRNPYFDNYYRLVILFLPVNWWWHAISLNNWHRMTLDDSKNCDNCGAYVLGHSAAFFFLRSIDVRLVTPHSPLCLQVQVYLSIVRFHIRPRMGERGSLGVVRIPCRTSDGICTCGCLGFRQDFVAFYSKLNRGGE